MNLSKKHMQWVVPRLVRAMARKAKDALDMEKVNRGARQQHFNTWQRNIAEARASKSVPDSCAVLLSSKNQFMYAFSEKVCGYAVHRNAIRRPCCAGSDHCCRSLLLFVCGPLPSSWTCTRTFTWLCSRSLLGSTSTLLADGRWFTGG